ncbi:MAG: LytTR family DNA-binding domain-containing protein [Eubacteriales bacterium]
MEIRLVCRQENIATVKALLNMGGIIVREEADLVFVEKGMEDKAQAEAMIVFTVPVLPALIESLKSFGQSEEPIKMLIGKKNETFCPIDIDDILFINAVDNNVYAHGKNKTEYVIRPKLYQLEASMLPEYFIRINKSEIVNIRHIQKIVPMFKGRLLIYMENKKEPLDISRSYAKGFKERLGIL